MSPLLPKSLSQLAKRATALIVSVNGERTFRRRLMEMGLVPGVRVMSIDVAPLGDPIEIEVRGCRMSIRRDEAAQVLIA